MTTSLRYLADVRVSNVDKKTIDGERPIRLCNYTDVYYHDTLTADLDFMEATATSAQVRDFGLQAGDTIITKDSETADDIGVPAFVPDDLPGIVCGYHLALIRPTADRVHPRFLNWVMQSDFVRGQLEVNASGVTRFGLTYGAILGLQVPTERSLGEQRQIADFLDEQVAHIDRVSALRLAQFDGVAHHERSRLAAMVTRCPERVLLRHVADVSVSSVDKHSVEGQRPVRLCNYTDVYYRDRISDTQDFMTATATTQQVTRFRLMPGDVCMTKDSETADDIGVPVYIESASPDLVLGYHCALLRPRHINGDFLYWAVKSDFVHQQLVVGSTGVTRFGLKLGAMRSVTLPFADPLIQKQMADQLWDEARNSAELVSKVHESRRLLKERKRSLITAAVTGELDVSSASSRAAEAVVGS